MTNAEYCKKRYRAKRGEYIARAVRWSKENAEKRHEIARRSHLRIKYGFTVEQYEALHTAQGGLCAICRRPEEELTLGQPISLAVDHDHKTGHIRGLLCKNCNTSIGKMRDDPSQLRAAADYLESHARSK